MLGLAAAALASSCPLTDRAVALCDGELRAFDRTDVFGLSPREVLTLSRALDQTSSLLRGRLPSWTWAGTEPLRLQLRGAAHLGRVYSRAYRRDPTDNSLPQEAGFENALLDLQRLARRGGLPACSLRMAAP
jgi:hypothetical protein